MPHVQATEWPAAQTLWAGAEEQHSTPSQTFQLHGLVESVPNHSPAGDTEILHTLHIHASISQAYAVSQLT